MHIVIAGAGRVGGRLATDLADQGHDVVVIDKSSAALDLLGKAFNGMVVLGEAYDVDVLAEADVERTDVFCAMTNDDNTNLMAVEVAKEVYEVPRVLARLQDPAREESYRALQIPHISTTNLIAAVTLERIVSPEFSVHITFSGGNVEIVEFHIAPAAEGTAVADLEIEGQVRVAAIRRNDETFIPDPTTALREGDLVVAATQDGARRDIERFVAEEKKV